MTTKQTTTQKALEFATNKTIMSPEDRAKARSNTPKKLGLLALSALTVFAAYNKLEQVGKVEPAQISTMLPAADFNKLSGSGLAVLTNVTVKAKEAIHFRNSCNFEDSSGQPLGNIVFELTPGATESANNTLHLDVAIPVDGPSADPSASESDVWFVVPTGKGNQAVCFDASEASRGADFSDVTTKNGESAVLAHPDATATLKDNNIYVNGNAIGQLDYNLSN